MKSVIYEGGRASGKAIKAGPGRGIKHFSTAPKMFSGDENLFSTPAKKVFPKEALTAPVRELWQKRSHKR
jgi:hypothetical protein